MLVSAFGSTLNHISKNIQKKALYSSANYI